MDAADDYGGAGSEMFEMLGGSASQQVATSFHPSSMRNVSVPSRQSPLHGKWFGDPIYTDTSKSTRTGGCCAASQNVTPQRVPAPRLPATRLSISSPRLPSLPRSSPRLPLPHLLTPLLPLPPRYNLSTIVSTTSPLLISLLTPPPPSLSLYSTRLLAAPVRVGPDFLAIVDSEPFQRLGNVSQLGCCYYVFRGASHKRLEHSIGTHHLACQSTALFQQQFMREGRPTKFKKWEQHAVEMAALCHDLGHGPWSHVFDSEVIPRLAERYADPVVKNWTHEDMSGQMLDYTIDELGVAMKEKVVEQDGQDGELFWKRVKDLINGSDKYKKKPGLLLVDEPDNPWMYEIVSNPRNGLDVDKFDYLQRDSHHTGVKLGVDFSRLLRFQRVIDNHVCYWDKHAADCYELFHARWRMHKTVYTHPKVKIHELMITGTCVCVCVCVCDIYIELMRSS